MKEFLPGRIDRTFSGFGPKLGGGGAPLGGGGGAAGRRFEPGADTSALSRSLTVPVGKRPPRDVGPLGSVPVLGGGGGGGRR